MMWSEVRCPRLGKPDPTLHVSLHPLFAVRDKDAICLCATGHDPESLDWQGCPYGSCPGELSKSILRACPLRCVD